MPLKRTGSFTVFRDLSRKMLGASKERDEEKILREEQEKLCMALMNREQRNELVDHLLGFHSDAAVKVRFLSAMNEYDATKDKKKKLLKGKAIVLIFFRENSVFRLEGIPENLETEIRKLKLEHLSKVKDIVSAELARSPMVTEHMSLRFSSQRLNVSESAPTFKVGQLMD
jgi:UPF0288 family protein (methanogenesis marker protein 3)